MKRLFVYILVTAMVIGTLTAPVFSAEEDDAGETTAGNIIAGETTAGNIIVGETDALTDTPNGYEDTVGHWAEESINMWSLGEKPVLRGYNDTEFGPDDPMRNAELDLVIARIFGTDDVNWTPSTIINRERAVKKIAEAFGIAEEARVSGTDRFADDAKISGDCKGYVYALKAIGAVHGVGENMFAPRDSYTRAEAVTVIRNMVSAVADSEEELSENLYEKSVVVRNGDITVGDKTIGGDILIGNGVGKGEVILDRVTVSGRLIVKGGGNNFVIVRNSKVNGVVATKSSGRAVTIGISDRSSVGGITVASGGNAIISGIARKVTVHDKGTVAIADDAIVGEVLIAGRNANVSVQAGADVDAVSVGQDGAKITGDGGVEKIVIAKAVMGKIIVGTPDTTVENNSGIPVVDEDGKTVAAPGRTGKTTSDGIAQPTDSAKEPSVGAQIGAATVAPPIVSGSVIGGYTVGITSVTMNMPELVLVAGDSRTLSVTVKPSDATNRDVNWNTSNGAVATVDIDGVVRAISAGEATVTVITVDGSHSATCRVTVTPMIDPAEGAKAELAKLTNALTAQIALPLDGEGAREEAIDALSIAANTLLSPGYYTYFNAASYTAGVLTGRFTVINDSTALNMATHNADMTFTVTTSYY